VKVVNGGSSIGVALPETREELKRALTELSGFHSRVIVEEKIRGREITQPILNDRYMSPIEIVPPEGTYFDYVAKYQSGAEGAQEICPARISEAERKAVGEAALKFHRALGLSVYSRVDFILDDAGQPWCLEVNTLPGMTPNSLIPRAARAEGMSYEKLCETIVELSLAERKKAN
jgi:D-alanine-D-alanine ligase